MTEPMLTRFTLGYVAEPVQAALNDETLQRIACYAAISTDEGHSYLPQTSGDAEQFRAHKWVIEAMREAARSAVTAALMGARVAPVLANECLVTASVPGNATHWRKTQPLPPSPSDEGGSNG